MSMMTAVDFNDRLLAVTRTHKMLNERRKHMSAQHEMLYFMLGTFAVLGLLGFAAIVRI